MERTRGASSAMRKRCLVSSIDLGGDYCLHRLVFWRAEYRPLHIDMPVVLLESQSRRMRGNRWRSCSGHRQIWVQRSSEDLAPTQR